MVVVVRIPAFSPEDGRMTTIVVVVILIGEEETETVTANVREAQITDGRLTHQTMIVTAMFVRIVIMIDVIVVTESMTMMIADAMTKFKKACTFVQALCML